MAGLVGDSAGAVAPGVTVRDLLLRAALLSQLGREAAPLAARFAALCEEAEGRSCVEAGAPLQITVAAPGTAELRVGLRLGRFDAGLVGDLMPAAATERFAEFVERLPSPEHQTFGQWLFWSPRESSLLIDLRDPKPSDALARLRPILDSASHRRLDTMLGPMSAARLWAVEIRTAKDGAEEVRCYWLLSRNALVKPLVEALHPGAWIQVVDVLSGLVRRPDKAGRWLLSLPLNRDGGLRVGNSGWTLAPEDDRKHRAMGALIARFGGSRDYAEAMWSLCRGLASPGWRVGRSCEIEPADSGPRVRLHLTPQVQLATTARINSAAEADSSISPTEALPSSE